MKNIYLRKMLNGIIKQEVGQHFYTVVWNKFFSNLLNWRL